MYYYDYSYIVLIPAILFTLWAQAKVKGAFRQYSKVANSHRISGYEAARRMLDANGLNDVPINVIGGDSLTNYYDPRTKSLNLSSEVYQQPSIASMCIACHEAGHAVQDAEHYGALAFRNAIVPAVNLTQMAAWPLILIGLVLTASSMYGTMLFNLGVICFCVVILFHLVTLPVEFNASNRALVQMQQLGMVDSDDYKGSKRVLSAAAMTYVAALAVAVANLLRILIIAGRRD
ncbi:MAG: zinc metallopeptidase [Clostridiales bacterium]|nr:zinc metallopeptidase [Candidatus Crickella merdequi]